MNRFAASVDAHATSEPGRPCRRSAPTTLFTASTLARLQYSPMKITAVRATPIAVPLSDPKIPWVWGTFSHVVVEIETDEGLTGCGEAYGHGVPRAVAEVVNEVLRPLLVGEDSSDIAGLARKIFYRTHLFGRYGVTTFAISGVDIALWDLAGKRAGVPLYQLLGGAESREVKAYASLVRYSDRDQMAADAEKASGEGYEMLKLHQIDVESIQRGREAMGDDPFLTVDVNCQWPPHQAVEMALAMDEYDLHWLEEPVWPPEDFRGLAAVMEESGVPLAAGENACTAHQFRYMIDEGAVRYPQPSVVKVGGISEFLKVATLAEAANMELAPHSPYFGPGFVATLHLIAHTRRARWIEKLYCDLETSIYTPALEIQDGVYTIPEGPGLGVDVAPHVLKEYAL